MRAFDFESGLDALRERALLRRRKVAGSACQPQTVVDGKAVLAFCSNDYLGLAANSQIAEALAAAALRHGVGSGASHLISGHHQLHETLEHELARFTGLERTLTFSTGYMANLALITSLVGRGDAVFSDALNHASLIDACRLSRATVYRYPHGDTAALSAQLAHSTAARKLIVTDAVFSMDGDLAPLPALLDLCEQYDALLVVDDAHGFGVLGDKGRGSLSHFGLQSPVGLTSKRIAYMATLGKAAGVSGAFIGGPANLIEWVLQKGRSYIFTTAAPPAIAAAQSKSIELIEHDQQRRDHLKALIARFRAGLRLRRWRLIESQTAIQPLLIGENDETLQVADRLMSEGLWVPAIRPPTVPAGSARLRLSFSAAHSLAQVDQLIDALQRAEAAVRAQAAN
jgi:8-amino-7-oxononanoate synthase